MQTENPKPDNGVGDSAAPPRKPKVRVPRLTSIANVRKEMARQYGEHLRGTIGSKALHARIFALKSIRESFIADDLAARLIALEERVKDSAKVVGRRW